MINTKNFPEEKVKNRYWKYELPETDKVQTEGDATEDEIFLDSSDNPFRHILGF